MNAMGMTPEIVPWSVLAESELKEGIPANIGLDSCSGKEFLPHRDGQGGRVCPFNIECPPKTECPIDAEARDLWVYRARTVAMLKRYARVSVETGRLPSLVGREFFRSRFTPYEMASFEDMVIFVIDVERALERLDEFQQQLLALNVLEEYSQWEIARLLGYTTRWIEWQVPEAIDALSRILLECGLLTRTTEVRECPKTCQEGKNDDFSVSDSKDGENIF